MTPALQRAITERDACRAYDGPDKHDALWGELDWEAEAHLIQTEQYSEFLATKQIRARAVGFDCEDVGKGLFDFQRDITRWALRRGRCAIFAGCGMGKNRDAIALGHARI